jgi:hypothetical protein
LVAVRARAERQLLLTAPTVKHAARTTTGYRNSPPEAGGQMHTMRHYRVRLWRSRRLPYRVVRFLLLVSPLAFMALALLVIAYIVLKR